jgi:hypothetical protein
MKEHLIPIMNKICAMDSSGGIPDIKDYYKYLINLLKKILSHRSKSEFFSS